MIATGTTMILNMFKDSNICINKMDGHQEIISRIKFISRLNKGDKINTKYMYVQPDGIATSLSRTFYRQDNRANAMTFFKDTINRGFELLITLKRSDINADKILLDNMISDLKLSKNGLENMKFSYISDTKFVCDIDTILGDIDSKLADYTPTDKLIEIPISPPSISGKPQILSSSAPA